MGHDKFDEDLGIENLDSQTMRNSEDKTCNERGKELLDICKMNDFRILNGRMTGDIFGKFTSHNWNGSSVWTIVWPQMRCLIEYQIFLLVNTFLGFLVIVLLI